MSADIINDLNQIAGPIRNPVLTIGNFDGVHKGHLAIFDRVKRIARDIGGTSAVMTFEPHPIKVMRPGNGPPLITQSRHKLGLISDAGIDLILCIPFTEEFATISAHEFVEDILVRTIGIKEIVVGYDYNFGRDRKGDIGLLRKMGEELGFGVHMVGPVYLNNMLVSSTAIRNLVREGRISEAGRLLGRGYRISGEVVRGFGRGRRVLGYPTANIRPVDELIPKNGIYAVRVEVVDERHFGVCNIGYNPTFGENALSIETHIFDFSRDIVGKDITLHFVDQIREEVRFESVEELSDQIARDILRARGMLGLHG